jgi:hypothetical protein
MYRGDKMKRHFVQFFSPGTLVAERTTKPIDSWNTEKAVEMSKEIKERYNALPYGFCFITRERKPGELDSSEVKRSPMYYLGGKILTLEEIKARNDPKDKILISNMEGNGWNKVVENNNSWKWVQPLEKDDIVLS